MVCSPFEETTVSVSHKPRHLLMKCSDAGASWRESWRLQHWAPGIPRDPQGSGIPRSQKSPFFPLLHTSLWRVHVLSALTSDYPKKTNKQSDRHEAIWSTLNHLANAMQCQAFRLAFISFLSYYHVLICSILFHNLFDLAFLKLDLTMRRSDDQTARGNPELALAGIPDIPRLRWWRRRKLE